jgi:hypothetical protein
MAVVASFEDACEIFSPDVLNTIDAITGPQSMPRLVDMIWPIEKANEIQSKLLNTILEVKSTIRYASYMKALSMLPEEDAVTLLMHIEAHLVPLLGPKATCLSNIVWSIAALPKHFRTDSDADTVLDFLCDDAWTLLEFSFCPERRPDIQEAFEDIEPHTLLTTMAELF